MPRSFTITIQEEDLPLYVAAFGYSPTIGGEPNPTSPEDHIKGVIKKIAQDKARDYLKQQQIIAATQNVPVPPEIEVS